MEKGPSRIGSISILKYGNKEAGSMWIFGKDEKAGNLSRILKEALQNELKVMRLDSYFGGCWGQDFPSNSSKWEMLFQKGPTDPTRTTHCIQARTVARAAAVPWSLEGSSRITLNIGYANRFKNKSDFCYCDELDDWPWSLRAWHLDATDNMVTLIVGISNWWMSPILAMRFKPGQKLLTPV